MPGDAVHHSFEYGEYLDIAIVINRHFAVGFKLKGVDDVRIVQIEGGGFISDIHGMIERQIPNREGFIFRIPCLHATLVLMVELREARCHLA